PSPHVILFPYTTLFRSAVLDQQRRFRKRNAELSAEFLGKAKTNSIKHRGARRRQDGSAPNDHEIRIGGFCDVTVLVQQQRARLRDRKSTRLNSSHEWIS